MTSQTQARDRVAAHITWERLRRQALRVLLILGMLVLTMGVALFIGRGGMEEFMLVTSGLGGLLLVTLLLTRPQWGPYILLGITYFNDLVASILPAGPIVSFGKLIGVVLLGSWLGQQMVTRRVRILVRTSGWLILAILLLMALSAWRSGQIITEAFLLAGTGLLFYILVLNLIRTERDYRRFIKTLLLIALVIGVFGFVRAAATGFTGRLGAREAGIVSDANDFALFLNIALPFSLVYASRGGRWAWLAALLSLFYLFMIAVTASRGAVLASTVTMLILGIRYRSVRYLVLVGLVLLIVFSSAVPVIGYLWDRVTNADPSTQMSTQERTNALLVGLSIGLEHPLLGVGPLRWSEAVRPYQALYYGGVPSSPHNTYIQAFAELGVPGLMLLLFAFGLNLFSLWRTGPRLRSLGAEDPWRWAMFALTFSYMASIATLNHLYSRDLFLVLVLLEAHLLLLEQRLAGLAERGDAPMGSSVWRGPEPAADAAGDRRWAPGSRYRLRGHRLG